MAGLYKALKRSLDAEEAVAAATVLEGRGMGAKMLVWPGGRTMGSLGDAALDEAVLRLALECLRKQRSERVRVELGGEGSELFLDVHAPPPKLVVLGAVHIAIPLVRFARILGFRTAVVDPRAIFATRERFPDADKLLLEWPQEAFEKLALNESTYVVILSHDSKLDNPALQAALDSPARYVGAIGSRKTHLKRVAALREMGVGEDKIRRIHSPVGLNLGGKRAEEIALSIIAEIVAAKNGLDALQAGSMALPPAAAQQA